MYVRARVSAVREIDSNLKKLSAVNSRSYLTEINYFVAVTSDAEFCLETTLLYNDTRNTLVKSDKICSNVHTRWITKGLSTTPVTLGSVTKHTHLVGNIILNS